MMRVVNATNPAPIRPQSMRKPPRDRVAHCEAKGHMYSVPGHPCLRCQKPWPRFFTIPLPLTPLPFLGEPADKSRIWAHYEEPGFEVNMQGGGAIFMQGAVPRRTTTLAVHVPLNNVALALEGIPSGEGRCQSCPGPWCRQFQCTRLVRVVTGHFSDGATHALR